MIRRLFVWCTTLGCLLLLWTQTVRAQQCTGQYANDPTYALLTAKDYAAQGGMTATVTATAKNVVAGDTGWPSHVYSVTDGTETLYTFTSSIPQGVSATGRLYYTINGGTQQYTLSTGLSGTVDSAGWWGAGNQIHLVYQVTDQYGNTTQDRIPENVFAGTAGEIVFQDRLETNFYWQTITTFGGNSMLSSCTECNGTGGGLPHCINATHTPYSTIQLTNSNSGESQLIQVQAGNLARSNESLTGNASLAISVLPGDSGTISIDDKIVCSADGVIFEQTLPKPKTSPTGGSWFPRATGELAFTKVALKVPTHCTPLLDPKGNVIGLHCDVAYYCSARSSPPDYQPTGLKTYHYTNPALVPPFWMSMSPGTALVFGPDGSPGQIAVWYFPSAELDGVLTGVSGMDPLLLDILSPAWVSDSSTQDCTKWISGISPWYMPKW